MNIQDTHCAIKRYPSKLKRHLSIKLMELNLLSRKMELLKKGEKTGENNSQDVAL